MTKRIPSLASLSYPERLAALYLEPLELRRLKSDLVLYYRCLHTILSLFLASCILQCQTSLHKREQVVIDYSVLSALPNFMKTTFFNRCVSCWNFYLIQWLMPASYHVSNAFYLGLMLICHPLHVVLIFNSL